MHHQAFHEQTKSVVTETFNDFYRSPGHPGFFVCGMIGMP